LLMAGCNTLIPGNLVMEAGGTLGSSVAPTLGAMALGGRVGLMIAHKSRIAVLRAAALLPDVGMVFRSVRSTLHATRTMRSAVEIVGIVQWLGIDAMCSQCNIVGWLACRIADTNSAWGRDQWRMHRFCVAPSWCGLRGHRRSVLLYRLAQLEFC
jgi:hypothetical protein